MLVHDAECWHESIRTNIHVCTHKTHRHMDALAHTYRRARPRVHHIQERTDTERTAKDKSLLARDAKLRRQASLRRLSFHRRGSNEVQHLNGRHGVEREKWLFAGEL